MKPFLFYCLFPALVLFANKAFSSDTTLLSHKMIMDKKEVQLKSIFKISDAKIVWSMPPLASGLGSKKIEYAISKTETTTDTAGNKKISTYAVVEEGTHDSSVITIDYSHLTLAITSKLKGSEFKITFPLD